MASTYSRLSRYEERRQQRRIVLAIGGSIALLAFLAIFGFKILVGFSIFVDRIRGGTTVTQQKEQAILLPPQIDPMVEATNSATVPLTGQAQPNIIVLLYVNDEEPKKVTVAADGLFAVEKIALREGPNTISAKTTDDKGSPTSDLSEVTHILYKKSKPNLEITSPKDGDTISGDRATVAISGKTDENVSVTINDRFVVVSSNGSFTFDLSLRDGEQTYKVIARDQAGNETTLEQKVKYQK